MADPTPKLVTELDFTVEGADAVVARFRKWFAESFDNWRKEAKARIGPGKCRKFRGHVNVDIIVYGEAWDALEKLAELFEREFPDLRVYGRARVVSDIRFGTVHGKLGELPTHGPLVIEFVDAQGTPWRGRRGAYVEDWDDDQGDEDEGETLIAECPCGETHTNPDDNEPVIERLDWTKGFVKTNVMIVSGRAYKVRHGIIAGTEQERQQIEKVLREKGGTPMLAERHN